MTVKVRYENGVLKPLEKIILDNHKIYEVEIKKHREEIPSQRIEELLKLKGILSIGGDALEDAESLYEE
jgi:predicted DNA-binding antitoxin AbrB/MazE fold protein